MPREIAPLDPVVFRETVVQLFEECRVRQSEDPTFKPGQYYPFYFVNTIEDDTATAYFLRFDSYLDAVEVPGSMAELERTAADGCREMHLAVLEAAAVVPFDPENGASAGDILEEARRRRGQIDGFTKLLGEKPD